LIGQLAAARLAQFGGVSAETADSFQRLLLRLPIPITAELPIRHIHITDGLALELHRQYRNDIWQPIEPFGDLFAFPAILQAAVDLLADGVRQPCDFPFSCHEIYFLPLFAFICLY
jgi:hypothetical protein